MTEHKTAFVASAHATDFVWRHGGAITLHAKMGNEITVACLPFGERGDLDNDEKIRLFDLTRKVQPAFMCTRVARQRTKCTVDEL